MSFVELHNGKVPSVLELSEASAANLAKLSLALTG
jgi:hypothetical protein